jgi:hypothetical protein
MLEAGDRLVLADGVVFRDDILVDAVAHATWPVNAAGAFVLARSGRALGDVADDVAAVFVLPVERARTDVLSFAWQLNRLALANVDRRAGRIRHALAWLRLAVRLAPAGALPAFTVRRFGLDTRTIPRAVAGVARAGAARGAAIAAAVAVLVAHIGLLTGSPSLLLAVAIGVAAGGGLLVHEAAHAAALRGIPSALVLRGRRVSVLHAPAAPGRRALVAIAGPGVTAIVGIGLLAVSVAYTAPMLALVAGPAVVHALALTVLATDGRTACGL